MLVMLEVTEHMISELAVFLAPRGAMVIVKPVLTERALVLVITASVARLALVGFPCGVGLNADAERLGHNDA